ncbi:MAG: aromatic ring-hydroxylating oxygenase subunit alpha [Anaerolineales bacterium]
MHPTPTPLARRYSTPDFLREDTYQQTRLPVDWASTLIPEAYRSKEFFDLEQERLWATSWVAVGLTAQVQQPGDVIVAEVAGQSILITKDKGYTLRAFYNVCRHRGAQLIDAPCHVRVIRCPYHSWGYDLEGHCIGTPLFEGSDIPLDMQGLFDMRTVKVFDRADYGLLPVRVAAWGCLIFVNLSGDALPLNEWLGDLPQRFGAYALDEWALQRQRPYHFNANWKLVAETFMEYYHLPWVHPELIKVSRMEDHYRWQGPGMYTGMTTSPVSPNTETGGWLALPPMTALTALDAVSGRFVWLFPNVAFSVLPNHIFIMLVTPHGPTETIEQTYLLSHPDSLNTEGAPAELDNLFKFWDQVNTEDIAIVERVQIGLRNTAYTGGRMCYQFEEPVHRFQNMVIDRMVGLTDRVPAGDAHESAPLSASNL